MKSWTPDNLTEKTLEMSLTGIDKIWDKVIDKILKT